MKDEALRVSGSAENNKAIILEQLRMHLPASARVLEIASGTGQHAVHFAANMPDVTWQPSDVSLEGMDLLPRLAQAGLPNIAQPILLDIAHWPNLRPKFDAVFSANCLHIVPEDLLAPYVEGCGKSLKAGGKMMLYGPYKYGGAFTTPSNEQFNDFLGETYPGGGIRDFERVRDLARANGMELEADVAMPANNQFLIFAKKLLP
ncbi:DUF938 domain-containing protein [Pseudahrensia aquimaris]|uniref:DUF938 domain-containing protein n=1 Tax=Pseudahrensia aquimaris TaxID=744461 RepID=A0ABW3FIQ6_9HYPH